MILEPDIVALQKIWSWLLPEDGGFPWMFVDCFGWKGILSSPILTLCITLSCRDCGIAPMTWGAGGEQDKESRKLRVLLISSLQK